MSRYPALLLDVKLMAIEDIDVLHQEPVSIHFSGGSCYASAHRPRLELLPPCYGSAPWSLLCSYCSLPICLFLSLYLLPEKGGGGRKRWRTPHLNNEYCSKSQPQRKQSHRGQAALYQKCQSSGWHDPSDPWWDHFSQVWPDRPCPCLNICRLTGTKGIIFDRLPGQTLLIRAHYKDIVVYMRLHVWYMDCMDGWICITMQMLFINYIVYIYFQLFQLKQIHAV